MTPSHRADIDGLRAVAVLAVCFFHAGVRPLAGGFAGVDVFFIISGYLMAKLISSEADAGTFTVQSFYLRRIRRIIPALYTAILFVVLACAAFTPPHLLRQIAITLCAIVLFSSNIAFAHLSANYFNPPVELNPLLHTWSLAVEEQFYVLFPVVMLLLMKWPVRWRLGVLAGLAAGSFAASVWGANNAPTAAFFLLPFRAWELLAGSALALWLSGAERNRTDAGSNVLAAVAIPLLGLLQIVLSFVLVDADTPFPGFAALLPCAGTLLVLAGTQSKWNLASWFLGRAPLVFVGKISYSLYLWHWPLIVLLLKHGQNDTPNAWATAGVLLLTGLIATLSWKFVEQPFRGGGSRLSNKHLLFAAAGGAAVFFALGLSAEIGAGFPSRFPGMEKVALINQLRDERRDVRWMRFIRGSNCFPEQLGDWSGRGCLLTSGRPTNALLWGDSFAHSYQYGFFSLERTPWNVLALTSPQCPPILGYWASSHPQCAEIVHAVPDIIRRYRIETVILAANWSSYLSHHKLDAREIRQTILILRSQKLRVVVVGQSPEFKFLDPGEYFYQHFGDETNSGRIYFAPVQDRESINFNLGAMAAPGKIFDPADTLCNAEGCAYKIGTQYLVWDYGHYTNVGSRYAVSRLLAEIGNGASN